MPSSSTHSTAGEKTLLKAYITAYARLWHASAEPLLPDLTNAISTLLELSTENLENIIFSDWGTPILRTAEEEIQKVDVGEWELVRAAANVVADALVRTGMYWGGEEGGVWGCVVRIEGVAERLRGVGR